MGKKYKKHSKKITKLDALKQINIDAAGIDVGDSEMYVAVPEDRDDQSVKTFGTFTRDLVNIAQWLTMCKVKTVAMESTGVYWRPLFEILTEQGFEVLLVDARKIKNVSGRKTDIEDCQWIQQLHTYGLLNGSFIPDIEIRALRDMIRHRANLIRYRASHIQHMQKILQMINLKLTNVISDITGTTGMRILRDIVNGQTDPKHLSKFRDPHCKKSEFEIEKSLEGNYHKEYIFQLKQMLSLYDYYTKLINELDIEAEKMYQQLPSKLSIEENPLKPHKRNSGRKNKNTPDFDLRTQLYRITGVDLTLVDGLNVSSVQDIITDIGTDMSKWATSKHFCSWLKLCPNNKITGGKVFQSSTKKTKNRANKSLRMSAFSLANANCALGAFYRRIRAKFGSPIAITATAHKLARIIYKMLKYKVEYVDLGADYYNEKYKTRMLNNLKHKAELLGCELIPKTT
ncbi:MAG: IS110 family transposase [Bacteroidetes bacterium]|nr:IS110 family transposase [Bacteroidota bacterium]